MLKSFSSLKLAQNYSFHFVRKSSLPCSLECSSFSEILKKAVEERVALRREIRMERKHGNLKIHDRQPESEEAKKICLEENPGDRVKRKKSLILLGYSGVNYCGMQRNPEVATIEEELLKAMLKNGWITEESFNKPHKASFQRASRTDTGVSAARQVVSVKLPESVDIKALNKDLPEDIKVFAVKKVTKGFDSYLNCDARSYSYTLPTYTFIRGEEKFDDKSFRLSSERLEELNKVLSLYVGPKNYHNFTSEKEHHDPSAKRFIISFECEQPFVPDDTEVEFVRLKIKGQSFMLHQIRKMVGLVIAIMRGYIDADMINRAVLKEKFFIPRAPGLGLVLDNVHYFRYNRRYGDHEFLQALTFEEENEVVEEFFSQHIRPTIIQTELRDESMTQWIKARLRNHSYILPGKEAQGTEVIEEN